MNTHWFAQESSGKQKSRKSGKKKKGNSVWMNMNHGSRLHEGMPSNDLKHGTATNCKKSGMVKKGGHRMRKKNRLNPNRRLIPKTVLQMTTPLKNFETYHSELKSEGKEPEASSYSGSPSYSDYLIRRGSASKPAAVTNGSVKNSSVTSDNLAT